MRKTILIVFCIIYCTNCISQTSILQGHILDMWENQGIQMAVVGLANNTKVIYGATTDVDGFFKIENIPSGKYDIKVSGLLYGADTVIKEFVIKPDSNINIQLVLLRHCKYDKKRNDNSCDICHKRDKVVPIRYGLPIGKLDWKHNYYAGCTVTKCDPNWYCRRCKVQF